jgi:ubiquinone/menaquinone biosynthesis C-methylase UbiE
MNHSITRNNYNRMSRWYDCLTSSEKQLTEIGLQALNIQPGQNVLEIGFGTGQGLIALANSIGKTGRVFGLDLSEGMIQVANKKILRAGLSERIVLHLGDATNLPFEGDFFDALYISFTLELFDRMEIPLVLGECSRVLSKGGRLGVVALEKKDCRAVQIYEWVHAQWPILFDCHPINVHSIIETAGFTPLVIMEKAMWGLPVKIIIARKI